MCVCAHVCVCVSCDIPVSDYPHQQSFPHCTTTPFRSTPQRLAVRPVCVLAFAASLPLPNVSTPGKTIRWRGQKRTGMISMHGTEDYSFQKTQLCHVVIGLRFNSFHSYTLWHLAYCCKSSAENTSQTLSNASRVRPPQIVIWWHFDTILLHPIAIPSPSAPVFDRIRTLWFGCGGCGVLRPECWAEQLKPLKLTGDVHTPPPVSSRPSGDLARAWPGKLLKGRWRPKGELSKW